MGWSMAHSEKSVALALTFPLPAHIFAHDRQSGEYFVQPRSQELPALPSPIHQVRYSGVRTASGLLLLSGLV